MWILSGKTGYFSGELMINLTKNDKATLWRKASQAKRPEYIGRVRGPPACCLKIMVWRFISYHGMGTLAFFEGNTSSEKCVKTLEQQLEPSIRKFVGSDHWTLQEDSASLHKSNQSNTGKRQHKIFILPWPAQSSKSQLD